jgi:small conductance mechanosensitive channel
LDLRLFEANAQAVLQTEWSTVFAILVVLVAMAIALRLLRLGTRAIARGILLREREPGREIAQKAKTLSQVVDTTGRIFIFVVFVLTILSLLGRDITPLLASAGIAGIAIGFGAQNIVKDWLGGFFILLENQYSVDDVIKVGDQTGVVEKLDLRKTVLRNTEGAAIVIPNGEVRVVTNLTKEWSRVVMDVGIPYEEDIERAIEVLRGIGEEVADDPELGKLVLERPEVLGVEALGEQKVTIRLWVKTLPSKQWTVARGLRVLVKRRFDEAGIGIPYPHQVTIAKMHPAEGGRVKSEG